MREKQHDWLVHSTDRRCHLLPYLKEMRRVEEGSTGGGERKKRVEKERKKGSVISDGGCPKKIKKQL